MALDVKSQDVEALAERLAARKGISKTEAVRMALQNEWDREQASDTLVQTGLAFCRDLVRRSPAYDLDAAGKDFIDSLYEAD